MSVPDEGYSRNVSGALFDTYASSLDVVLKPYFGGIDEVEVRKAALTGSDVTGSHVTGSDVSHVTEECYAYAQPEMTSQEVRSFSPRFFLIILVQNVVR
jgi:hypothetical protein